MKLYKYFIIFALVFISCQDKKEYIHWDRDMCQRCKMVVSDRKNSLFVKLASSKHIVFDDIGCFILWRQENFDVKIEEILINDSQTGEWIDAKKAFYTAGNITPMGFGFWAYKNENQTKGKKVFSFFELEKLVVKKDKF